MGSSANVADGMATALLQLSRGGSLGDSPAALGPIGDWKMCENVVVGRWEMGGGAQSGDGRRFEVGRADESSLSLLIVFVEVLFGGAEQLPGGCSSAMAARSLADGEDGRKRNSTKARREPLGVVVACRG